MTFGNFEHLPAGDFYITLCPNARIVRGASKCLHLPPRLSTVAYIYCASVPNSENEAEAFSLD